MIEAPRLSGRFQFGGTMNDNPVELSFNNKFVRRLNQIAPALPEEAPPTIYTSNTKAVIIKYSQEDWLKVYSALITGADLVYPEDAHNVVYLFTQFWDNYMDICQQIADCINNSELVQNALIQWLEERGQSSSRGGGTLLPPQTLTENLLPPSFICDDEHAMGMAESIIDYLDSEFLTVLAQIEIATNDLEVIALLVDNSEVTSLGGSVLELTAWLQDTLAEVYDVSNTEAVKIELACSLYCYIKTCSLSVEDLTQWASENAQIDVTVTKLLDVIDALIVLDPALPPREIVSSAFWLLFQLQRLQANSGLALGLLGIQDIIRLSADETSNAYLLCDDCPVPEEPYCYNIVDALSFGATILTGRGLFVSGGLVQGKAGTGSSAIRADLDYNNSTSGTLSSVILTYSGTGFSPTDSAVRFYLNGGIIETVNLPASGDDLTITFTLSEVPSGNIRVYFDTGRSTATLLIKSLQVNGIAGGNPYPALSC